MKPIYHDVCCHDRPRDRFLGTIEADSELGGKTQYDVYVYQDNSLTAPKPDMHVCMRYGEEGPQYISPGRAEEFVKRVQTERVGGTLDGKWPAHYEAAATLIKKWMEEQKA